MFFKKVTIAFFLGKNKFVEISVIRGPKHFAQNIFCIRHKRIPTLRLSVSAVNPFFAKQNKIRVLVAKNKKDSQKIGSLQ